MDKIYLKNLKRIHFISIGGIGVSSIARMMILQGKIVSGSDISDSGIIQELKKLNCKISIGHEKENKTKDIDLIVYTLAITKDNPELIKAEKLNIKSLTYPKILGLISKNYYTIAISGTHGKTTTTSMAAKIFIDTGLKPTAIIGSLLKETKSNFIAGEGKFFIVEACEYRRSFLNLKPKILAITNIDNDHLDYYKNINDIRKAFSEFVLKIPKDGFLICNLNDPIVAPVFKKADCQVVDYSKVNKIFKLKFPGRHNLENAKIAFAIGKLVGIDENQIINSLENFSGTWRRFDFKGKTKNGALVYDDYAHHPTEIKATLTAFKEKFPEKRIIVIFQPHLFSRTKILLEEFSTSFKNTDEVIVTPIYAAREKKDESINSNILAEKIRQSGKSVLYLENFDEIVNYLINSNQNTDIIVTMGAGDIYKVGERLIEKTI